MSMPEVARIAAALGHGDLQVFQTGNGTYWVCTCACGYRSTRRPDAHQAQGAAGHHLVLIARKFSTSGLTIEQLEESTSHKRQAAS